MQEKTRHFSLENVRSKNISWGAILDRKLFWESHDTYIRGRVSSAVHMVRGKEELSDSTKDPEGMIWQPNRHLYMKQNYGERME